MAMLLNAQYKYHPRERRALHVKAIKIRHTENALHDSAAPALAFLNTPQACAFTSECAPKRRFSLTEQHERANNPSFGLILFGGNYAHDQPTYPH